jgi:hypothetical protein
VPGQFHSSGQLGHSRKAPATTRRWLTQESKGTRMKQPVCIAAIVVAAAGALAGGTGAFGTATVDRDAPAPVTAAE